MDTAASNAGLESHLSSDDLVGAVATAPRPTRIPLHGAGNATLTKSRYSSRVTGRIRYPEKRAAGNLPYIAQLFRACVPLAVSDVAALLVAVALTGLGFSWQLGDEPLRVATRWLSWTVVGLGMLNLVLGLYPGVRLSLVEEIRRLCMSLAVLYVFTIARMDMSSSIFGSRMRFATVAFVLSVILMPLFRGRARRWLGKTNWWGFPTLVCGHDAAVVGVYQWMNENRRLGLLPLGVVTDQKGLDPDGQTPGVLGDWRQARELAEKYSAYWAVLVDSVESEAEASNLIEQHLGIVPHVLVVSERTGMPDNWNRHQADEGLDGLLIEQHLLLPVQQIVKRGMDLAISVIAMIVLAPLFLVLAVAIKLTSPGPVFYGHQRVGKGNTRFKAWKFRTMVLNAEQLIEDYLEKHPEHREEWLRDHKIKNDPRVTPLGRWMRKWSVDELPQVWNVLWGEMSAVGPRPIVENEIETYGEHFETFCTVLPGMTGLWQVSGRNDTTFEERIQLGMYYIHHWSPWLDMYLLFRTVKTVLFTKGAY
jgi:Undecaprenyl-phosphate galactose phosphotransferase WbaP